MRWLRLGKIFTTQGKFNWATNYALQPTPLVMKDRVRVYVGLRDDEGVGRVGWVDLALNNPDQVIGFSEKPALDIGQPGAFDEFGVIPSAVIEHEGRIFLFYAGYQRGIKVRFLVFGGLAVSYDGGDIFSRVKKTPIFERTDNEVLFRVPHSVLKDEGKFRFWYGGSRFEVGKEKHCRFTMFDILSQIPWQRCHRMGRFVFVRRRVNIELVDPMLSGVMDSKCSMDTAQKIVITNLEWLAQRMVLIGYGRMIGWDCLCPIQVGIAP